MSQASYRLALPRQPSGPLLLLSERAASGYTGGSAPPKTRERARAYRKVRGARWRPHCAKSADLSARRIFRESRRRKKPAGIEFHRREKSGARSLLFHYISLNLSPPPPRRHFQAPLSHDRYGDYITRLGDLRRDRRLRAAGPSGGGAPASAGCGSRGDANCGGGVGGREAALERSEGVGGGFLRPRPSDFNTAGLRAMENFMIFHTS